MATALKVLGQAAPAATTNTDLYTVPAATSVSSSSIIVCNQSATPTTFRVALRIAGAAITAKQYLYYDVSLPGNDTFIATIGISLATTDVVTVYCGANTVSFTLLGQEIT